MMRPPRSRSDRKRSVVWTLRPRVKNDLGLPMGDSLRQCALGKCVGPRLVPEQAEHPPGVVFADELDRVHSAPQRVFRVLVPAGLVVAPDLRDIAESLDASPHLE